MNPVVSNIQQVNRVLDVSPAKDPSFVFVIGAAGSGKSTLASNFRSALRRDDMEVAKFDDSKRWGMDRWESHQHEFPDFESCAKHFVTDWIRRVSSEFHDKRLVLCDVNTTPDILNEAIQIAGIKNYKIVLVQPSEGSRELRLANDPSRQAMEREVFLKQLNSDFAMFLTNHCAQLAVPRIQNEESAKSLNELGSVCMQVVRSGV